MQYDKSASDGIGTRLRRLLAVRGETIKSLSDRTGIPYRTLHNHVGGSAKPNAEQMALLIGAGIDANFLLAGKMTAQTSLLAIALSEDEKTSLVSDAEILEAIDQRAVGIVDAILASEPHNSTTEITFDKIIEIYKAAARRLASLISGSEVLIAEAKRKGLSLDKLMGPILDAATGVFVKELAGAIGTPENIGDNRSEKPARPPV